MTDRPTALFALTLLFAGSGSRNCGYVRAANPRVAEIGFR